MFYLLGTKILVHKLSFNFLNLFLCFCQLILCYEESFAFSQNASSGVNHHSNDMLCNVSDEWLSVIYDVLIGPSVLT